MFVPYIIKVPDGEDWTVRDISVAHFLSSRKAAKCEKQVQGEGPGAKVKSDNHLDQVESKLRWFMPSPSRSWSSGSFGQTTRSWVKPGGMEVRDHNQWGNAEL